AGAPVPSTGRYALQGRSLRAGLEAWAREHERELVLEDDQSDPQVAARVHEDLAARGCNPVLGPYGSDTTRPVARARAGTVGWTHGAAADDVQRLPGVVSVPSPASCYLAAVARAAVDLHGVGSVAVLTAPGSFARLAKEGLEREADGLGVRLVAEDEADCILLC